MFRIASITKTFTAAGVYLLEKRGQLKFDDRLSRFLPGFPRANEITVRQLLSHTSGVGAPDLDAYIYKPVSLDEIIDLIAKSSFQFDPGKGSKYSNSGYTLLAKIIEIVSANSYEDFLRKEFFEPLHMTYTGNYSQDQLIARRSSPYVAGPEPEGVSPVPGYDELCYLGSGSLWSTSDDLLKWLEAVQTKHYFDIDRLDWPMGWGKRTYFNRRANEQTGISPGFSSGVIYFPEERLSIIVLSNIQTQFVARAIKDLAGMFFGEMPKPLVVPPFCNIKDIHPQSFIGKYITDNFGMEISVRRGGLYFQWIGTTDYHYLSPINAKSLYIRDESALLTWISSDAFEWEGPYGKMQFKRSR